MNGPVRAEIERRGETCVVRIRGDVDLSNADELRAQIEEAVPNGDPSLSIDLTHTTYLDSAGVQLLFELADRLRQRRSELVLIVPPAAPVRAVLELTGLLAAVTVRDRFDQSGAPSA